MGFMKEQYSNNRGGLLVTFGGGDTATESYTPTDSVQEALAYFDMYVKDGIIYTCDETEELYDAIGAQNAQELTELRDAIDSITAQLDDEIAVNNLILFKVWSGAQISYRAGERIRYNDKLYKVLQDHISQSTWTPTNAPSLFTRILTSDDPDEILEWEQPDSTNPYMKGDKVIHNGIEWTSLVDNNVWEPGTNATLWESAAAPTTGEDEDAIVPEYVIGNVYQTGDRITFNNELYESSIDNNAWSPADYPAGWIKVD